MRTVFLIVTVSLRLNVGILWWQWWTFRIHNRNFLISWIIVSCEKRFCKMSWVVYNKAVGRNLMGFWFLLWSTTSLIFYLDYFLVKIYRMSVTIKATECCTAFQVRFDVLMPVRITMLFLWVLRPFEHVGRYQRFEEHTASIFGAISPAYYSYGRMQTASLPRSSIQPWRWRRCVSPKRYLPTSLQGFRT